MTKKQKDIEKLIKSNLTNSDCPTSLMKRMNQAFVQISNNDSEYSKLFDTGKIFTNKTIKTLKKTFKSTKEIVVVEIVDYPQALIECVIIVNFFNKEKEQTAITVFA